MRVCIHTIFSTDIMKDRLQTTSHLLFIHGLFNNSFSYSDHMSKDRVISEELI